MSIVTSVAVRYATSWPNRPKAAIDVVRKYIRESIDDADIIHGRAPRAFPQVQLPTDPDGFRRVARARRHERLARGARALRGSQRPRLLERRRSVLRNAKLLVLDHLSCMQCQHLIGNLRDLERSL